MACEAGQVVENDSGARKEPVNAALTFLNNQSAHLDVYKKESIAGERPL